MKQKTRSLRPLGAPFYLVPFSQLNHKTHFLSILKATCGRSKGRYPAAISGSQKPDLRSVTGIGKSNADKNNLKNLNKNLTKE
jgi:hypothetical protein